MAFDLIQRSIFGGKPYELIEFAITGQYWRYTSEDSPVVFNSVEFTPLSEYDRGSIRVTQNIERSEVNLRLRGNVPIAEEFLMVPPSEPVICRIYQRHRDDSDYVIRVRGQVMSCSWSDDAKYANFKINRVSRAAQQPGLRRAYQYNCPYVLYGTQCRVNKNVFEVVGTVSAINGLEVTFTLPDSFVDGYFNGGFIEWESGLGRRDRRMVTGSVGATITLQLTSIGLSVGDTVRLYPGCDHTIETCYSKFNNADWFGGFPFMPTTNPFAGTTIF